MKKTLQIVLYLAVSSALQAGYLENLLKQPEHKEIADKQIPKTGSPLLSAQTETNITSERELSLVLLSFEKEAEDRLLKKKRAEEKAKKLAAKKKAEKAEKAKKKESVAKQQNKRNFPSLEEQLTHFQKDKHDVAYTVLNNNQKPKNPQAIKIPKKQLIYGIFCKNQTCYALGEHRIFKEGDIVNGQKIMEIDTNFIRYKNNQKVWYTR